MAIVWSGYVVDVMPEDIPYEEEVELIKVSVGKLKN